MEEIIDKAIESVEKSIVSFCKFLSPNDTKATNAHQSGYLIGISAWQLFLDAPPPNTGIVKIKNKRIRWQDDFSTDATFTYYSSKGELRLTGMGKGFPFREEHNAGDLFILAKQDSDYYEGFILSADEDIEDFFAAVGISADETNRLIPKRSEIQAENKLLQCFELFLKSLNVDFPPTSTLASAARNCYSNSYKITETIIRANPDTELLKWINTEFELFKYIENNRYSQLIHSPFKSIEELIVTANTILNRRKSRAGKSLEHHLAEMFNIFNLSYSSQCVTEGNKKPDFVFPSVTAYHDSSFDKSKLIVLASKTTCKDRWRQILNEADKVDTKHLFTLQQGISTNQLIEMYDHNVQLIVPNEYIKTFAKNFQNKIMSFEKFLDFAKAAQS